MIVSVGELSNAKKDNNKSIIAFILIVLCSYSYEGDSDNPE
jgi:hypothetical protein